MHMLHVFVFFAKPSLKIFKASERVSQLPAKGPTACHLADIAELRLGLHSTKLQIWIGSFREQHSVMGRFPLILGSQVLIKLKNFFQDVILA